MPALMSFSSSSLEWQSVAVSLLAPWQLGWPWESLGEFVGTSELKDSCERLWDSLE